MLSLLRLLCAQERIQLSQAQLTALIKVRRTLLAHIGALLAEREQIGTRIRVRTCLVLSPNTDKEQAPPSVMA